MIAKKIKILIKSDGSYLDTILPPITANEDGRTIVQVIAPFPITDIVSVNYSIRPIQATVKGSYLLPTGKFGKDVLDEDYTHFQTVADWNVFEIPINAVALEYISKYRAGLVLVSFTIKQLQTPYFATNYLGLFSNTQPIPATSYNDGDYFIANEYNFTAHDITWAKGDYAYFYNGKWNKGKSVLKASTPSIELPVDPSLKDAPQLEYDEDVALLLANDLGLLTQRVSQAETDIESAENDINEIDGRVGVNETDIYNLESDVANLENQNLLHSPTFNGTNGHLTFQRYGASPIVIDLPTEMIVTSGVYDDINNELVLNLASGGEVRIPVGNLLTDLDAENIRFNGSGTNYLTAKTEVEGAIKELDTRVKTNAEIADGSLTTTKYADDSVTEAKLNSLFKRKVLKLNKASVVLGTLNIDTVAKTVTWTGTNCFYGHDNGISAITNKDVALSYTSNNEAAYIYVVNNELTVGTENVDNGYLIGILYVRLLYSALSNHKINIDGQPLNYTKKEVDDLLINKLDKSSVTFKKAFVSLGSLNIDTTALTVTWAGTNCFYGHDTSISSISNKNVALSYTSNSESNYIYVKNGVLKLGATNETDGYLIGVLYNKKLYHALSNHKIFIDGVQVGAELELRVAVLEDSIGSMNYTKKEVDDLLINKLDKSSVTFKKAFVSLGSLNIDTTALTVTWAGTNCFYGHDTSISSISNKNVALSYTSNSESNYIYVKNGVLKLGATNETDGYLIGVLYNKKLYHALSNHKIFIDGVQVGAELELRVAVLEDSIGSTGGNHKIVMPNNVYLLQGKALWGYMDNLVSDHFLLGDKYYPEIPATGRSIEQSIPTGDYKRVVLTGDETIGNVILNVASYPSETTEILATKTFNVACKAVPTGKTLNTLVIGDSFIQYLYGDGILKYISDFATADGNTISFKGTKTQTATSIKHEGRGGWSELDYLKLYVPTAERDPGASSESKKMPSPFVFSTDDTVLNSYFSFAEYMSTNGITGIDNIVFFLGMNGGFGTDLNTMIANIKTDLPTAKIFVSMIPPSPSTYAQSRKASRHSQNLSYVTKFDGRQVENVYLMPTHLNVHPLIGIQNDVRNLTQFPELEAKTEFYNTGVHPTAVGAKSIAYVIYNYLAYFG